VSQATDQQVWKAKNKDGTYTVALFNLGGATARVTANFSDLGFNGTAAIRDLWQRKEASTATGSFSRSLPSHGSALFRVTPDGNTTTVGGRVTSSKSGRCIDDPRSSLVNGTQLTVWDCNGGDNQKVTYNASTRSLMVLGKCFDAHEKGTTNGTAAAPATSSGTSTATARSRACSPGCASTSAGRPIRTGRSSSCGRATAEPINSGRSAVA
jgi:alpha-galactosidase